MESNAVCLAAGGAELARADRPRPRDEQGDRPAAVSGERRPASDGLRLRALVTRGLVRGGVLLETGETLPQVLRRVLGPDLSARVPLFTKNPGFATRNF